MADRGLHHVEIWVDDLGAARPGWEWLLHALGWLPGTQWTSGLSWCLGATYLVIESGADVRRGGHERCRAGLNHLAFHAGSRADVDRFVTQAAEHGWSLLFPDRHPHAGGPQHYAAYLENADGFEVELVADDEA